MANILAIQSTICFIANKLLINWLNSYHFLSHASVVSQVEAFVECRMEPAVRADGVFYMVINHKNRFKIT